VPEPTDPADQRPRPTPSDGSHPATILLAEDDPAFRATAEFHLAMAGYPVISAADPGEILQRAQLFHPDVVVVSATLGGLAVEALVAALRTEAALDDVPIVTLGGGEGPEEVVACLDAGARDHVRRGEGPLVLLARLAAVLRTDDELERLRRRAAELEFLGSIDPLTGMANRRHVEEELDRLAAGATRHDLPLSMVLARVDTSPPARASARQHYEAVLRELAFLVAAVRRTDDLAGVWDERTFAVLLPVTPLDGAKVFAERLRSVVAAAPIRAVGALIPVTISASCAEVTERPVEIVDRLETGLAALELQGGNAVIG